MSKIGVWIYWVQPICALVGRVAAHLLRLHHACRTIDFASTFRHPLIGASAKLRNLIVSAGSDPSLTNCSPDLMPSGARPRPRIHSRADPRKRCRGGNWSFRNGPLGVDQCSTHGYCCPSPDQIFGTLIGLQADWPLDPYARDLWSRVSVGKG